jgi:hypothetical protein
MADTSITKLQAHAVWHLLSALATDCFNASSVVVLSDLHDAAPYCKNAGGCGSAATSVGSC